MRIITLSLLMAVTYDIQAGITGEQLYRQNCMVCHADDGSGAMPGVFDLSDSRAWSTIAESQLLARLKQGIQTSGTAVSMPPKGGNPELLDKDLLAIISYMRKELLK